MIHAGSFLWRQWTLLGQKVVKFYAVYAEKTVVVIYMMAQSKHVVAVGGGPVVMPSKASTQLRQAGLQLTAPEQVFTNLLISTQVGFIKQYIQLLSQIILTTRFCHQTILI